MKKNVGSVDKIVRLVVVLALAGLFFSGLVSGAVMLGILAVMAVVFLVTAISGYCPLYTVFGFTTCPMAEARERSK